MTTWLRGSLDAFCPLLPLQKTILVHPPPPPVLRNWVLIDLIRLYFVRFGNLTTCPVSLSLANPSCPALSFTMIRMCRSYSPRGLTVGTSVRASKMSQGLCVGFAQAIAHGTR